MLGIGCWWGIFFAAEILTITRSTRYTRSYSKRGWGVGGLVVGCGRGFGRILGSSLWRDMCFPNIGELATQIAAVMCLPPERAGVPVRAAESATNMG